MAHAPSPVRPLPTPDVVDSDFGAFQAAVLAQQATQLRPQGPPDADRLIADALAGLRAAARAAGAHPGRQPGQQGRA